MRIDGALGERAYEELHRLITSGSFPPGFAIREVDLVRMLGVSRTPVREALRRLEADGLITPLPGSSGYLALELDPQALADIYKVRTALERLSVREACARRTGEHLARMRDSLAALDRAFHERDAEAFSMRAFFTIVGEASGNAFLQSCLARVNNLFRYRALSLTYPELFESLRRDIEGVYRAIEAREPEAAERCVTAYFEAALQQRIEHNGAGQTSHDVRNVAGSH